MLRAHFYICSVFYFQLILISVCGEGWVALLNSTTPKDLTHCEKAIPCFSSFILILVLHLKYKKCSHYDPHILFSNIIIYYPRCLKLSERLWLLPCCFKSIVYELCMYLHVANEWLITIYPMVKAVD